METKAWQSESMKPACPACGHGRGLGSYTDNDNDTALTKRCFYLDRPNHLVGSINVPTTALDHTVECLNVQPSNISTSNIARPAIAGRFNVLVKHHLKNPANAGFFSVQETTMLKKAEPVAKYETQPSYELQQRADEIIMKMKEERQQQREAMAHLFLAGPEAWPDYPFDETLEDEDFEEWIPLDA